MSVTDLSGYRESLRPTRTGPARCLHCKHEWVAVLAANDDGVFKENMECPSCGMFHGFFKGPLTERSVGGKSLRELACQCGEAVFKLWEDGNASCMYCGKLHEFP